MSAWGARKLGDFPRDTLANWQARGTDHGVAVGDAVWDLTNARMIRCSAAIAGSSTWVVREPILIRTQQADPATALLRYIILGATGNASASLDYARQNAMPGATRIEHVDCFCAAAADVTIVGIHVDANTTPLETQTETIAANTWKRFSFEASTLTDGQRLGISIDPTVSIGNSWINVIGYTDRAA